MKWDIHLLVTVWLELQVAYDDGNEGLFPGVQYENRLPGVQLLGLSSCASASRLVHKSSLDAANTPRVFVTRRTEK